jgi:hypothetical protein
MRESMLALTGFPFTIREIFAIYGLSLSAPTLPAAQSFQLFQGHNMGRGGNEQPRHRMV